MIATTSFTRSLLADRLSTTAKVAGRPQEFMSAPKPDRELFPGGGPIVTALFHPSPRYGSAAPWPCPSPTRVVPRRARHRPAPPATSARSRRRRRETRPPRTDHARLRERPP